jgi:dipeptide/tripeptide permease
MVYVSLFGLIVIGAGGIKSCVNVLGAQQFHPTLQKEAITRFFTYFYASINVGSIVGGLAVPQVADSVSYAIAYLIPLSFFIVASAVFFFGRNRYVRMKPQGSPVVAFAKVVFFAMRNSFDDARESHGGPFEDALVDDCLALLRLLPVLSVVMPLLMAYNQMTTAFLTQGEKMNSSVFGLHFAPALMQTLDPVAVVIATVLLDSMLFTYLRRINRMPQVMTRFAIGNFIGGLALMCAFFVELAVKAQDEPNTLSIWWQVPQFSLIAVAEIFTISTSYEVAFTLAPTALKTVASACNLIYFAISGIVAGLLFVIFEGWMPDFDENDHATYKDAHYDYYFLVLVAVCLVGVVASFLLRPYFTRITTKQKHIVGSVDDADDTRATALEERSLLAEDH